MKLAMIAAATLLGLAGTAPLGTAMADEVIIHRDAPAVVEEPAPSSTTTVEKHESADGCASKTVHKENDAGDSKTVHTENCD